MSIVSRAAIAAYTTAYQISPIVLTGGIASSSIGQALPIIALLGQAASLVQGIATSGLSNQAPYAEFLPVPGSTVISQSIGQYPFANQDVAANAVIRQPLNISLVMIAPVKDAGGYLTKLPVFTALRESLSLHNASGGTYSIATPSYIYTDCVMLGMQDVTEGATKQQQVRWQLDFTQPLISLQQAQAAYSSYMSKLANGQPTNGLINGQAGTPLPGALNSFSALPANIPTFSAGIPGV